MRVKSAAVPVEAHQHPSREISNAFMVKDHTVATRGEPVWRRKRSLNPEIEVLTDFSRA